MAQEKETWSINTDDYETTNRMLIIPQQEENRQFLLEVDRSTKELVRQKFLIFLEYDWYANTIATVFLECVIETLRVFIIGECSDIMGIFSEDEDHNKYADILGLLKVVPTMRTNEKAEKAGSINCKFIPGDRLMEIITDATPREMSKEQRQEVETYYLTDDERINNAWDRFDTMVRSKLASKYKIAMSYHFSAVAITDCYLECLYRTLAMHLARMRDTEEFSVSTNVNDYFEIYALSFDNPDGSLGVKFTMTPGMYAKKGIKDDLTTENDD